MIQFDNLQSPIYSNVPEDNTWLDTAQICHDVLENYPERVVRDCLAHPCYISYKQYKEISTGGYMTKYLHQKSLSPNLLKSIHEYNMWVSLFLAAEAGEI